MIRQFDVFRNPLRHSGDRPFVLNIQHPNLDVWHTRVVVPLVIDAGRHFERRLNPSFKVLGRMLFLSPTEPAALPVRRLRNAVVNLDTERDTIVAALDMVFTGV